MPPTDKASIDDLARLEHTRTFSHTIGQVVCRRDCDIGYKQDTFRDSQQLYSNFTAGIYDTIQNKLVPANLYGQMSTSF